MASLLKKKLNESAAGRLVVNNSKRLYLPGFKGFSLYEVWSPFLQQLRRTSLVERASGISFNIVMALPPTLIFIFTLIPFLPISKQFVGGLFILIKEIVPGEKNNKIIIDFLKDFIDKPRNGLLSFGLLTAVYFSSNAMMGILRAFNKDYPGFMRRSFFERRMIALQLTMIIFILVSACILILIGQGQVLNWLGIKSRSWHRAIGYFRWSIIFLLFFYIVSFIYRHGAAVTKKWPLLTPGAIFATTLMIIATGIVSYWVNNFNNYNKLYGSISAIFILMSLIYANALAVLMGFELNVTLYSLKQTQQPISKALATSES